MDFGEEPGTSPKAGWWDGGGGSSDPDTTPMTSHKSWMPEYGESRVDNGGQGRVKSKKVYVAEPRVC